MGEIAEDCYDRAMDELDWLESDPEWFGFDYTYRFERPQPVPAMFSRRVKVASADDFADLDTVDPPLPDDFSDLA